MQVAAHNGWITGMDLASASGLLLSCAEDSYVRVWQLSGRGPLVEHWFSAPVTDCLMAGAKFLDPRGSSFCVSAYDSSVVQVRREETGIILFLGGERGQYRRSNCVDTHSYFVERFSQCDFVIIERKRAGVLVLLVLGWNSVSEV